MIHKTQDHILNILICDISMKMIDITDFLNYKQDELYRVQF